MGGAHKYLSLFPTPLAVLPRRIYLIQSSSVMFPFDSLEAVRLFTALPSIPASFTNITVYLELEAGNNDIYFTASAWPLNDSLAPPACVLPSLDTIAPEQNIS